MPPPGDELVSIIIFCCNEAVFTKLCLESVLRLTRSPYYELILIDNNGSIDETPAYLESLKLQPGPARVVVIRNDINVGFPAGCNQGIANARGRYLLFLNNDTVVTPQWLEDLVGWVLHDWPKVGMVGAISNYSAEPQQIAVDYPDLSGLEGFAGRQHGIPGCCSAPPQARTGS